MGLDMYGYTMRAEFAGERQTDVMPATEEEREQAQLADIAYWRKFNHLHGWMEKLYREKGGVEVFNCRTVRLELDDLERLERALANNELEYTPGCFFGGKEIYPEDITETEKFIAAARAALANGLAVFYDSWW
ncbi:phosphoglycerate kinase [Neisseria musculi]|uniref:Phosphoglycerate kinase n=1 Tax=Neisseria musculi TaxID=1815583 RepID=A0A7H1M8G1_9NEIS|nr:phosphoglycerate kinase [Neisseria musculi]QNT57926.1 putative phosphoglycerate kinase [Neisseria musculi]QNT59155.1 putative phosphoglycerate kinase [Neisseria musculi]